MATTMKAFKLVKWGQPGQYVDVPIPAPGAGEVLIKISAVGLCRSDLDMVDSAPGSSPYANSIPDGYTLGHENVGRVTILGYGVTDIHKDEAVAVHHMRHCGNCEYCSNGAEQHCEAFKRNTIGMTRGCGLDGGLAEYLVVPRTELISLGDRDPIPYAPLTNAGITAYHAVQTMISRLRPGTCAAVIGIGGLGVYGLQFLKLLSPARIFALDVLPARLKLSKELGADYVIQSDERAADTILRLTNGRGVHAVIDFVGNDQTLAIAARVSRPGGRIVLVGMDGGTLTVGWGQIATNCEFSISLGSTVQDLRECCALATEGRLRMDMQTFGFDQIQEAYDLLRAGQLQGRATIVFD